MDEESWAGGAGGGKEERAGPEVLRVPPNWLCWSCAARGVAELTDEERLT